MVAFDAILIHFVPINTIFRVVVMANRLNRIYLLLAMGLMAQAPALSAEDCVGNQVYTDTGDINLDLSCNINETNRDSQSGRGVSAVSKVNSGNSGTVDVKFTGSVTGDKRYSAGLYVLSDTDNGNSGDVKVDFDGDVGVGGYESRGVYAASWSGEVWGSSDGIGSSGDVDVSFD